MSVPAFMPTASDQPQAAGNVQKKTANTPADGTAGATNADGQLFAGLLLAQQVPTLPDAPLPGGQLAGSLTATNGATAPVMVGTLQINQQTVTTLPGTAVNAGPVTGTGETTDDLAALTGLATAGPMAPTTGQPGQVQVMPGQQVQALQPGQPTAVNQGTNGQLAATAAPVEAETTAKLPPTPTAPTTTSSTGAAASGAGSIGALAGQAGRQPGQEGQSENNQPQGLAGMQATGLGQSEEKADPVSRALGRQVAQAIDRGWKQQMPLTIRLTPPELGTVRVTVMEQPDGVHIRIHADEDSVRSSLEKALATIRSEMKHDSPSTRIELSNSDRSSDQNTNQQNDANKSPNQQENQSQNPADEQEQLFADLLNNPDAEKQESGTPLASTPSSANHQHEYVA